MGLCQKGMCKNWRGVWRKSVCGTSFNDLSVVIFICQHFSVTSDYSLFINTNAVALCGVQTV
jgi:hypothetical protein